GLRQLARHTFGSRYVVGETQAILARDVSGQHVVPAPSLAKQVLGLSSPLALSDADHRRNELSVACAALAGSFDASAVRSLWTSALRALTEALTVVDGSATGVPHICSIS